MNRVPPSLINLDNQMEDFWEEYKRKTTRIVTPEEIPEGFYWEPVEPRTEEELRKQWMDAYTADIAQHEKRKPWKLKALIALGLMLWFWWMAGEYVLRMVR